VRHQDERSGELQHALLQHLEGRDVEVVRGSSSSSRSAGSSISRPTRPGPARPREPADGRLELLRAEQKAPRPARDVDGTPVADDGVAEGRKRALQRYRRVEPLPVLIEHHHPEIRRVLHAARVGRLPSRQQAQQRALATAFAPSRPTRIPGESTRSRPRTMAARHSSWPGPPRPGAASSCVLSREVQIHGRCRPRESRSASSSMRRPASSMRACALRVRARALRESQSSSPRTRLRSDSWYAACPASSWSFFVRYRL